MFTARSTTAEIAVADSVEATENVDVSLLHKQVNVTAYAPSLEVDTIPTPILTATSSKDHILVEWEVA